MGGGAAEDRASGLGGGLAPRGRRRALVASSGWRGCEGGVAGHGGPGGGTRTLALCALTARPAHSASPARGTSQTRALQAATAVPRAGRAGRRSPFSDSAGFALVCNRQSVCLGGPPGDGGDVAGEQRPRGLEMLRPRQIYLSPLRFLHGRFCWRRFF